MAGSLQTDVELVTRAHAVHVASRAPTHVAHVHPTAAVQILVEQYDGQVPGSWEGLEALPGVGHKTASVVMSQAFG